MTKAIGIFLFITLVLLNSCTANQNKSKESSTASQTKDSTVYETKDTNGRVIERWGNYYTEDRNMNFRHFFYYDEKGLLTNENQYWFDDSNKDCVIKDTAEYDDIYYYYKFENSNYILEQEKCYGTNYSREGKFIGRKLYYIHDEINDKFIFRDDAMGETPNSGCKGIK